MPISTDQPLPMRHAVGWSDWWPGVRAGLLVLALFALGLLTVRHYEVPLREVLAAHEAVGIVVFVATSALAVLLPMLSNLYLVPVAVLAWGPGPTAALLLLGWIVGAVLAFALGRHARAPVARRFPSVTRHADIDRLIHPRYRLLSLTLLRVTFPVDVLSYALGMFSRETRASDNALSTALGAAPFAVLFAWFPTLDGPVQLLAFGGSIVVFAVYAAWVLRRQPVAAR